MRQKRKKALLLTALLATAMLTLTGCTDKLVGTWKTEVDGKETTIEFTRDNIVKGEHGEGHWLRKGKTLYLSDGGEAVEGEIVVLDRHTLIFQGKGEKEMMYCSRTSEYYLFGWSRETWENMYWMSFVVACILWFIPYLLLRSKYRILRIIGWGLIIGWIIFVAYALWVDFIVARLS